MFHVKRQPAPRFTQKLNLNMVERDQRLLRRRCSTWNVGVIVCPVKLSNGPQKCSTWNRLRSSTKQRHRSSSTKMFPAEHRSRSASGKLATGEKITTPE